MSLYYQPHPETQPLNSHREKARKRVKMKRMLPAVGIAAVAMMVIGATIVVFVSSGHTFRKPLSETDPDLYYSHLANEALMENLASRKTKKPVRPGCEATVILMRHCERYFARTDKENKYMYCGYLGLERANYLATLFGDGSRWPAPSRLYALDPIRPDSDTMKFWQADTLEPTAERFRLMVKTGFTVGDECRLAKAVFDDLRKGNLCGKLVVISWSHDIPALAQEFGCGPYNGCPYRFAESEYDATYQIKFVYNSPEAGAKNEKRLFGDHGDVGGYADNGDDMATNDDDDDDIAQRRRLGPTKSFFHHRNTKVEAWEVHGAVVNMNFDPLSFSASVGDYPKGGKAVGGSWRLDDGL
mmetsp:Transcript_11974/g.19971  ORF Transcript_11974/g.19971 Transcript_11974/m.19971 type:complete len:357 (-) Transcript_11974:157-1227(-)